MIKSMEQYRKEAEEYRSPWPDFNGQEGYIDPEYTE